MRKLKKETMKQVEAFEYYYVLGNDRSLRAVAKKVGVTRHSISRWSRSFHWQERLEQRDIANAKTLREKTDKAVVSSKANYRAEIKGVINTMRTMLDEVAVKLKEKGVDGAFSIESTKSLKNVVDSYEKLCKLDLTLMGEASGIEEIKLKTANEELIKKINKIVAGEESREKED